MSDLKKIKEEFLLKLKQKLNLVEINQIKSDLILFNSLISNFLSSLERNSSFIFLRSDIFTDYFFSKIKQ